jgi:hypothetical protein
MAIPTAAVYGRCNVETAFVNLIKLDTPCSIFPYIQPVRGWVIVQNPGLMCGHERLRGVGDEWERLCASISRVVVATALTADEMRIGEVHCTVFKCGSECFPEVVHARPSIHSPPAARHISDTVESSLFWAYIP